MTYWAVLTYLYLSTLLKNKLFSAISLLVLFLMAAFIAPDVSHDFQNYYNGYYLSNAEYFPEPISRIIFNGANRSGMSISVSFVIFAFLSIIIKFKAIKKLALPVGLFLIIYFGKLFLLLDLTQVRAAVAISLCLLAFEAYIHEKKITTFMYIMLAFLFHLSSIMFMVIYFVNNRKPNVLFWFMALLIGLALSFIDIKGYLFTLMALLHAPANYLTYVNGTSDLVVNPFNTLACINVIIFLIFCYLRSVFIDAKMNVAFKLYGISIVSFYMFIDFPVLSFRISEFFLVYQVVLLSNLIGFITERQRWIYITLMFLFSCVQLYITYNNAGIIESYSMSIA
ncbi:EpsG family protein [Scandinavium sp. M-37]|uniref:EpsG family protein n=1 Tax=Scandinavium sp. M-37 TaxID=3373077 RepID=UPI0037455EAF